MPLVLVRLPQPREEAVTVYNGIFRIEYPTGHMDLIVRNFFWEADMRRIRKVLRLAKEHYIDAQRHTLISLLRKECEFVQDALDEIAGLEQNLGKLIAPFGLYATSLLVLKKQLSRRIEKYKRVVEALSEARWQE